MSLPDWLLRLSPSRMGAHAARAPARRRGLFARHLCRAFDPIFADPRSRAALAAAERFTAGELDEPAYRAAVVAAEDVVAETREVFNWADRGSRVRAGAAVIAHSIAAGGFEPWLLPELRRTFLQHAGLSTCPRKRQFARAVRPVFFEHFGNPDRPAVFDPSWRTEAVVALARGIDADAAYERMPVLADALEDAGCADEDLLGHCRSGEPHGRGCWLVDQVLGRE